MKKLYTFLAVLGVIGIITLSILKPWSIKFNEPALGIVFNTTTVYGVLGNDIYYRNIRAEGTLTVMTTTTLGSTAVGASFPLTNTIISQTATGYTNIDNNGLVSEAKASAGAPANGIVGVGQSVGSQYGAGVTGIGYPGGFADAATAFGLRGISSIGHSGGSNVAVYAYADGGSTNNSFFGAGGDMYNNGALTIIGTSTLGFTTFAQPYSILAVSTTLNYTQHFIEASVVGTTYTLPTAIGHKGVGFEIDNASTGNITVLTTSSQTINGLTSQSIPPSSNISVVSNGVNWRIK